MILSDIIDYHSFVILGAIALHSVTIKYIITLKKFLFSGVGEGSQC